MKKLLTKYKNGNYDVLLFEDGTKIRMNNLDNLTPAFAESMDIHITSKCDNACNFCYANCTPEGKHADLFQPLFNTLHPGTEIAINGNDLSHPQLVPFLQRMHDNGIIVNMAVNQRHFKEHYNFIKALIDSKLIYGLGVSLNNSSDPELITLINQIPNAVLHTIDGLLTEEDIRNLSDKNIKLLVLGYKIIGRGDSYYQQHKEEIEENINRLAEIIMTLKEHFTVISFDNLAIEHLRLKSKIAEDIWQQSYMGDEGAYTFFVDVVNHKFAVSSLETTQFDYTNEMTVDDMFNAIREYRKEQEK